MTFYDYDSLIIVGSLGVLGGHFAGTVLVLFLVVFLVNFWEEMLRGML